MTMSINQSISESVNEANMTIRNKRIHLVRHAQAEHKSDSLFQHSN